MQKREMCRKGLGRASMMVAFFLTLLHGQGRAGDSWERGMGGVMFPRWEHPAALDRRTGYLLVSASAANPFSMPGLYESTAFISAVSSRRAAGIRWERTGMAGYSRDLFEAVAGLALPGGLLRLNLIVRADIRGVAGYGRETSVSAAWSVFIDASPIAAAEMEPGTGAGGFPARASVRAGRGGAFLILTLDRYGPGDSTVRAGGSVRLAARVSFLAGYDIGTGEVSGGLAFLAPARTAFSWSVHPVLGTTFSISVGALR